MIRIRDALIAGLVFILIGTGIWFFIKGRDESALGAGGLPLIRADANPAKLPPEDPGGEVMPNADSTVFSAMDIGDEGDPSMEGVRLPEDPADSKPSGSGDFAGLRTGFAVPVEPETKTESLFENPEYKDTGESKYLSGLTDEPVLAPSEAMVAAAETAKEAGRDAVPEKPLKIEKVPAPVAEKKQESPVPAPETEKETAPPQPAPIADILPPEGNPAAMAQSMEAAEKAAIRPVAKPQPDAPEPGPAPEEEKKAQKPEPVAPPPAPKPEDAPYKPARPANAAPAAGGYYIQLASSPAGSDMAAVWNRLKSKYAVALAGLSPVYQNADIPGMGAYIRLQAGPIAQAEANDRCKALRRIDPKGGCLVVKR